MCSVVFKSILNRKERYKSFIDSLETAYPKYYRYKKNIDIVTLKEAQQKQLEALRIAKLKQEQLAKQRKLDSIAEAKEIQKNIYTLTNSHHQIEQKSKVNPKTKIITKS